MLGNVWDFLTITILAAIVLAAYAIKKKSEMLIQVPLPYAKTPWILSINDMKRIIALQNQDITLEMIEVLKKYNNENKMPSPEELNRIDPKIPISLAGKAYIEPESPKITDIRQFKLGYVGRQILESQLDKKDLFDPVSWHEDLKRSI